MNKCVEAFLATLGVFASVGILFLLAILIEWVSDYSKFLAVSIVTALMFVGTFLLLFYG